MIRNRIAPVLLLASLLLAARSDAGVIHGRLTLARPSGAPGGPLSQEPGVSEAVIFVESVPERVESRLAGGGGWFIFHHAPARPLRVVQADLQFRPRVLATPAGRPVEFLNLDHVYHNAFSVSAARRFDLGKNPPGRSDTVMFDRPGIVNVHCDIHPRELGYIVVTPNHVFARPDAFGRYALPKLPPGRYEVHAWHPRHGEIRRTVEVPRHGDVPLDLGF